jgi:hypothetical protein
MAMPANIGIPFYKFFARRALSMPPFDFLCRAGRYDQYDEEWRYKAQKKPADPAPTFSPGKPCACNPGYCENRNYDKNDDVLLKPESIHFSSLLSYPAFSFVPVSSLNPARNRQAYFS